MRDRLAIVGFGANVDPERNVAAALSSLLARFGELHVSRITRTRPIGVPGDAPFLNGAVAFRFDLETDALKAWFNTLETAHGRDRTHPDRKILPRPLDLDILVVLDNADAPTAPPRDTLPQAPYALPFVLELLTRLGMAPDSPQAIPGASSTESVSLSVAGRTVGLHPTTLTTATPLSPVRTEDTPS